MRSAASIFHQTARNRWFAVGLLLVSAWLLCIVTITFDDEPILLPNLGDEPVDVNKIVPVNRVADLAAHLTDAPKSPVVNGNHLFFTTHFKVPEAPAPAPVTPEPEPVAPTPPPVLKKFVLLYQGVYRTAEGIAQAFLKLDDKLLVMPTGSTVLRDWNIAEISPSKLTLTNAASETTILEFNREKTLEVQEQ